MDHPVLITGATGTIGARVVEGLRSAGVPVRVATRHPGSTPASAVDGARPDTALFDTVRFDFTDSDTWAAAFDGVRTAFIVRPPQVSNVRRDMIPALEAARDAGVRHLVLLSLQGVEGAPFVPHAKLEAWMRESGLHWTFVRPSFFMENLTGVHASDVRDRDRIVVPAGRGRTSFVAAADVAAVAVAALAHPEAHLDRAWTPTGSEALTYSEVAEALSAALGRDVAYARPGAWRYAAHARRVLGLPWAMVGVTTALYTVARLGRAAGLTDDVMGATGVPPITLAQWAAEHAAVWKREPTSS